MVSLIVPIYRIERYVGICIESLIRQTYNNLEIILIDDGSDDRCPDICDLYAKKDKRIKVIHKSNGGLVSARKVGLACSSGEYIGYVDGDDWLEIDYVERMLADALANKADIVCAGQKRDLFEQSVSLLNSYPVGVYREEKLDCLKMNMLSNGEYYCPGITTYVWNKLFRRTALYSVQMSVDERISIGEDAAVVYPAILRSKCVCVTDCTSYHYRQREDSMLKKCTLFSVEAENLKYLYEYLQFVMKEYSKKYCLGKQIIDYVLSICIIRSGGRLPGKDSYSIFDSSYFNKRVVIFSAGTFGQQLVKRFKESMHCTIVKWIDDDYWEYRRCCLNVDSVESINDVFFDYVLIATVDCNIAYRIKERLILLGVDREKLLAIECPENMRKLLIRKYLYEGESDE